MREEKAKRRWRERPPVLEGGLAGQVSRGARSAADHFDPRPHQSSPNHTPLISTRRGTKAVHVLHVMHVTARAHAPLSLSVSLSVRPSVVRAPPCISSVFLLRPLQPSPYYPPLHPSISTRRWSRVLVIGLRAEPRDRGASFEIDVWEYRSDNWNCRSYFIYSQRYW